MRAKGSLNGITIKAYSGTTGILLAFDITDKLKKEFLGFAIKKIHKGNSDWLQSLLRFPGDVGVDYALAPSNIAPIQKFRWSDYAVYEGTQYTYEIQAVHGKPGQLRYTQGPAIEISTQTSAKGNRHEVVFNRAVASSQSYEKRFGATKPNDTTDPKHIAARTWLSRGIKEKLLNFLLRADGPDYTLDVAIYEFEVPEVAEVLNRVVATGAQVRLMYHSKKRDPQTTENEHNIHLLDKKIQVIPRFTSKIFHNKLAVLRHKGKPVSVVTGSTNFTNNAFYLQANVVHIFNDPEVAGRFAELFEQLLLDIADKASVRDFNGAAPTLISIGGVQTIFSPKRHRIDIDRIVSLIKNAKENFILCTAFDVDAEIVQAIQASDKIKYGLQNSRSELTGIHRNQTFVVPDFLKSPVEKAFKEEGSKRRGGEGNIYIHLKTFVIDFATDQPVVIMGSNNFSDSASLGNDENMVVIENDVDVADLYMIEMFRLYDHYRFRFNANAERNKIEDQIEAIKLAQKASGGDVGIAADNKKKIKDLQQKMGVSKPITLAPDNGWTRDYFDKKHNKFSERKLFM